MALARILLPEANLPLTTSLTVLTAKEGDPSQDVKRKGDSPPVEDISRDATGANPFAFGANVIMKK